MTAPAPHHRKPGRFRRLLSRLGLAADPAAPVPAAPAPVAAVPAAADAPSAPARRPAAAEPRPGARPWSATALPAADGAAASHPDLLTDALAGLAMRDLTLVDALLAIVEKLEDMADDPDLLDKLFEIDNLATRMRRNGENLLVLADQEAGDPNVEPVPLLDVARAATSEIRDYSRVHIGRLPDTFVAGAAADDLSHLLAELLDNATTHSPDHAQVVISGQTRPEGGLLLTVEDEGIGIPREQLTDLNVRLSGTPVLDERVMRHMGLYVASRIAHRHGLLVQLEARAFRGTNAYTVIPARLLTASGPRREPAVPTPGRSMPSVAPHPLGDRRPAASGGPDTRPAITAAGLPRRSAARTPEAAAALRTLPPDRPAPAEPAEPEGDRAARIRDDIGGFIEGERAAVRDRE
jgi:hypothetical protein